MNVESSSFFARFDLNGNPQRVPKPSRALAPTGKARLRQREVLMGTLKGFPNPPALWLRRAKPVFANAKS